MGYILTPIAVDLKQVATALGSKDKRLVSVLVTNFGNDFKQFDEMAADRMDEEEGEPLTMRDALTHLIMGQECNDELGFMYGYAFEFLCLHFGEMLSNAEWSAMPSGAAYAEEVDKALKAAKIDENVLRMKLLMFRGAPVPLPKLEDSPCIGYLRAKEVAPALKALDEEKLAAIKDAEIRESLTEVRDWLQTCADSGRDLVCFYC